MIERTELLAFFKQKGYPSRSNDEGWYEWITDETLKYLNAEKVECEHDYQKTLAGTGSYYCVKCGDWKPSEKVEKQEDNYPQPSPLKGKPSAMGEKEIADIIASMEFDRDEGVLTMRGPKKIQIMQWVANKLAHAIAERMKI